MSRLLGLRKRINVIYNVDKIIKAMQAVTLGKVRRAQQTLKIVNNYLGELVEIINENFEELKKFNNVFDLGEGPRKKKRPDILLVLFTAFRSFSGDFTDKIFQKAREFEKANPAKHIFYLPLGTKGEILARNKKLPLTASPKISEVPNFSEAQKLAQRIRQKFQSNEFREIYFIYNRFKSIFFQVPEIVKIFPAPDEFQKRATAKKWFIWEPTPADFGEGIFQKYLAAKVYQVYFESFVSELSARIINLRAASESSEDLIKSLSIQINKARQNRITEELTEIVSSYEIIREETE